MNVFLDLIIHLVYICLLHWCMCLILCKYVQHVNCIINEYNNAIAAATTTITSSAMVGQTNSSGSRAVVAAAKSQLYAAALDSRSYASSSTTQTFTNSSTKSGTNRVSLLLLLHNIHVICMY